MATLVCCKRVAAWAGWSNITSNKKNLPVCHNVHIFSSPTLLLLHSISSMLFAAWLAFSMVNCYAGYQCKLPSINSDFNVPHMVPVSSWIKYCTPSLSFRHVTPMHYDTKRHARSCWPPHQTGAARAATPSCWKLHTQCGANGRSLNISLRYLHKCDCTNLCPYFWNLEGFFSMKIKKSGLALMGPKLAHATEHSSTRVIDSHLLGKVDSRSLLLKHRSHKAKLGCFQFLSMQTWAKVERKEAGSDNSSHHVQEHKPHFLYRSALHIFHIIFHFQASQHSN